MPTQKTTVLVMFGGRSPEHDVSIISGLEALNALDPALYEAIPLYVYPDGQWYLGDALRQKNLYIPGPSEFAQLQPVSLHVGPSPRPRLVATKSKWLRVPEVTEFDIVLPIFHGLIGEDGPVQGLLECANIPYAGMRLLASTVLMDKVATKKILAGTGVPMLPWREIVRPPEALLIPPQELATMLGDFPFPCCVKPAHLGSSIGVARVQDVQELADVLPSIFKYDTLAIIEPFVENLVEYNVAVCRKGGKPNGEIITSAIERPKRATELLDFKTKYLSGGKTGNKLGGAKSGTARATMSMLSMTRDINPDLPDGMDGKIRKWATTVYAHVSGTGAPRLDFLSNAATGEIWFNEANPIPGSYGYFLWEAGANPLLFTQLVEQLIAEGLALHRRGQIPLDPTPEEARLFKRKS